MIIINITSIGIFGDRKDIYTSPTLQGPILVLVYP